jgi:hypothetical protein
MTGTHQILIVTPRKHQLVQATAGLVHSVLGRINRVLEVRVLRPSVGVDDFLFGNIAANDEGVSNDVLQQDGSGPGRSNKLTCQYSPTGHRFRRSTRACPGREPSL